MVIFVFFISALFLFSGCGGNGGDSNGDDNGGDGDKCAQLQGVWDIIVPDEVNTCPPPALQGIWNADWHTTQASDMMTVKFDNSDTWSFEGPFHCDGSNFSFDASMTYPDVIIPRCFYTATFSISAAFSGDDQFTGPAEIRVEWGPECGEGGRCRTSGTVIADKIS